MSAVVNDPVLVIWRLGVSGEAGNISTDLNRYPDGSTETNASETVTVAEIGATGSYALEFTPVEAQLYVLVATHATFGLTEQFAVDVAAVASSSAATDAYCDESDVRDYAQLGDFTATTVPTESTVLRLMANRAGQLYTLMWDELGTSTPSPAGGDNPIDSSTSVGLALKNLLRQANAISAAADAIMAAGATDGPGPSERPKELLAQFYNELIPSIMKAAAAYIGRRRTASTHISSGEVTTPTVTPREHGGLTFDSTTEF